MVRDAGFVAEVAMSDMTIGKAAAAAGVGVETIRFYERKGLIARPPRPAGGGFRTYPEDTVRRVRFIREAQALGFSLREAAELLQLRDAAADAADVRERAHMKLADVDAKIERLQGIRAALAGLVQRCPGAGSLDGCSIMAALEIPDRPRAGAAEPREGQR
jgi:MerR family mercuric resistance operon transcriptional regulator